MEALADIAYRVNQTTQNIGARRLYTLLERLLEDMGLRGSRQRKKTIVDRRGLCERQARDDHAERGPDKVYFVIDVVMSESDEFPPPLMVRGRPRQADR